MHARAKVLLVSLVLMAASLGAHAQTPERQAYRHVDANGKVTYSQTPPVDAKGAKAPEKIDIAPALRGRGGYVDRYGAHDSGRHYTERTYRYSTNAPRALSPSEQRLSQLKAECERQRGTDCNNPSALQYLDFTQQPRVGGTAIRRVPPNRPPHG